MQLHSARSRYLHVTWLRALLLTTLLPQILAHPLSLGCRLSTISPEFDFADLRITDAFGTTDVSHNTNTRIVGSLSIPPANLHYAITHPDKPPILSTTNMFFPASQWVGSPPIGPSSLTATLQTMLDRLIVSARYTLGLPMPLAFLMGLGVMFLFVLSSLFSVLLLWEIARWVVRGRGMKEEREFVIRSRVMVRANPRKGILSPGSSRNPSANSEEAESPCPKSKRVKWVDEERGCVVCAEGCRAREEVGGDGDVAVVTCGVDFGRLSEMEKVD